MGSFAAWKPARLVFRNAKLGVAFRHPRPREIATRALTLEVLETRVVPSFKAARSYDTGPSPDQVAVGDFRGNGLTDLAVVNYDYLSATDSSVSVLLGNGDGSFQAARTILPSTQVGKLAVADLNGDGRQDLVVSIYPGVSVLLSNGDGSFQAPRVVATGGLGAVGDFNGDGIPDLAVTSYTAVSVLLGNGDGTFRAAGTFDTGTSGVGPVAVGDFCGNGTQDLAIVNGDPSSTAVTVMLGNGDGSFQAPHTFAAGTYPNALAVGDFNGDGKQDLVVADYGDYYGSGSGLSVLLGNGDGSFQAPRTVAPGSSPYGVAVADLNGDGIPDLAIVGSSRGDPVSGSVDVLLGNGDATFQDGRPFAAGTGPSTPAVADFNGDGLLDLAVADGLGNDVSVLLGSGGGSFVDAPAFAVGHAPGSLAVGDFNGDGIPDLAVANQGTFPSYSDSGISVLLGNGDSTFQAARAYASGLSPVSVVVGDFNGDGIPDLAFGDGQTYYVYVLLGNGDGTFQSPRPSFTDAGATSVAVGDFNGDGIADLAVTTVARDVTILLGNGDGTFQAPRIIDAGSFPNAVAVDDFNGDGKADLVVANSSSQARTVSVLLGNGDGTFQAPQPFAAGIYPDFVTVGDFNGDGISDLAVVDDSAFTPGVNVLLGNGDGTFQAPVSYSTPTIPYALAVGDFNGDGKQDLAVAETAGLRVLLGNGNGTFQVPSFGYAAAGRSTSVAVGDFNGDGLPDLAVTGFDSNEVIVFTNDGLGTGPVPAGGRSPGAELAPPELALLPAQGPDVSWADPHLGGDLSAELVPPGPTPGLGAAASTGTETAPALLPAARHRPIREAGALDGDWGLPDWMRAVKGIGDSAGGG